MRQKQALGVMLSGRSVFLTGAPGAGKTYVLNEFIDRVQKRGKRVAVTASTGIAATHIGGTTIHSWSGLGIRERIDEADWQRLRANEKLKKRYNAADILVIDEISMLHGTRLNTINEICKLLRQSDEPFGGLQVVLVGDLFQLPPVNHDNNEIDFAHLSEAWEELEPAICYLSEQFRQRDNKLLGVLEAMRRGDLSEEHANLLGSRIGINPSEGETVTRLFAHNIDVDSINQRHLASINEPGNTYEMHTKGSAAKVEQLRRGLLAPDTLELKLGAEVMFVANDFAHGFVNGSRGRVVGFDYSDNWPLVKLSNSGKTISVEPHTWSLNEDGRVRAEVSQLPLRLAWAMTIHKSQGMSLDAAVIDLGKTFTPGMGYVALSRLRSLEGVYLLGLNRMALQLHENIFAFDKELQKASEELSAVIDDASDELPEAPAQPNPIDQTLLRKLKDWRRQRAAADKVPAYIVAHDSVLESIATHRPSNSQALMAVKGFGSRKVDSYGVDILSLVNG